MAVRMSALSASHTLPPGRFLVLISVRGGVDPTAIMRLERLGQLVNELIRNWTCDFPACSIVPQPTTLPRTPNTVSYPCILSFNTSYWKSVKNNIFCEFLHFSPIFKRNDSIVTMRKRKKNDMGRIYRCTQGSKKQWMNKFYCKIST
jgi:hypothetical protein